MRKIKDLPYTWVKHAYPWLMGVCRVPLSDSALRRIGSEVVCPLDGHVRIESSGTCSPIVSTCWWRT
jgi:hypothetical protein